MLNSKQIKSKRIYNYIMAHKMIAFGLRPPIAAHLTGLPWRTTTDLWFGIHGHPQAGGKLPESIFRFMKNKVAAANISAFAAMHVRLFPNQTRLGAEELLTTFTEYICIDPDFDINAAYRVAQDLCVGIVTMRKCPTCRATYVSSGEHYNTKKCPFCRTRE